jgi:hypothetical protein
MHRQEYWESALLFWLGRFIFEKDGGRTVQYIYKRFPKYRSKL